MVITKKEKKEKELDNLEDFDLWEEDNIEEDSYDFLDELFEQENEENDKENDKEKIGDRNNDETRTKDGTHKKENDKRGSWNDDDELWKQNLWKKLGGAKLWGNENFSKLVL